MSGQKVTVCTAAAPVGLKEPSQQQLAAYFYSAFFYCVVIRTDTSVLSELSQEVPPPQQHLSV